jgi:predicted protein tyrosine phosphatase
MPPMKNVLFVCGRNRWRSPTAEQIFSTYPGVEVESAGTSPDADNPLTPDLVEWADIIFVMENMHRRKLSAQFRSSLKQARVICLNIPDRFAFMDPELVRLLTTKITPHLK